MDANLMQWIVLAVGGALGGNILGALTRGGGGVAGRTIIGAIGGAALGYLASMPSMETIRGVTANWGSLMPNDPVMSGHIANLITGAIGGGVLGLIGGLLIRPRN